MRGPFSHLFSLASTILLFGGLGVSWGRVLQQDLGEIVASDPITTKNAPRVGFVWSEFSLLSGDLDGCPNATADSCEGGIATAMAWLRQQKAQSSDNFATFVLQSFEFTSVFVQMHPLGWNVNRFVLHNYFGLETYYARNSFLGSHKADLNITQNDLSGLQAYDIQPLVGNTVVDTTNSWSQYLKHVHFDPETRLATIIIDQLDERAVSGSASTDSPIGARRLVDPTFHTKRLMNYIAQVNQAIGCGLEGPSDFATYVALKQGLSPYTNSSAFEEEGTPACWIPVVVYTEEDQDRFQSFVEEVIFFDNPPSLILYTVDTTVNFQVPRAFGPDQRTWVVTFRARSNVLKQVLMELEHSEPTPVSRSTKIVNVTLVEEDLEVISDSIRQDPIFQNDVAFLKNLADEAALNNPVLGYSDEMPFARPEDNRDIRPCMGGECAIGSLYADSLRWFTGADFAFTQSGGVRGPGWPAGPVRVSNVWEALPFANTECTGTISGINLYRIFELSTSTASFQTLEQSNGDRLMQVSGLRYTYNTLLDAPRLINLEIWDKEANDYVPVERLGLYTFVTSSWMCGGFDPFPSMLSEGLTIPGEEPSVIGGELMQNILADYLRQLDAPYNTTVQGRLVNDTQASQRLNFIQTEENCNSSTFWVEKYQTCFSCPSTENVLFTVDQTEFSDISGSDTLSTTRGQITNGEDFPIEIALKSMPSWTSSSTSQVNSGTRITIAPKSFFSFDLKASSEKLSAGLATAPISFAVLDGGDFPGCVSRDLVTEISFSVDREPTLSETGSITIVGFCLLGVIWMVAIILGVWVYRNRENAVLKAMQPGFLMAICVGVMVIAVTIAMMSLKNLDVNDRVKDASCMAQPWFLSMGISIVMGALFTKLWRLNKVVFLAMNFRRKEVPARQAFFAFAVIFSINFVLMIIWTFVAPTKYTIESVEGEGWNLYGKCALQEPTGIIFMGLVIGINFTTLLLAMYQAYRAREISSQFSESKGLGLAIFSWVQLGIVGLPVLFLIDEDNVRPRYFLQVALIFGSCLSMMFFVFSPMFLRLREQSMPVSVTKRLSSNKHLVAGSYSFQMSESEARSNAEYEASLKSTDKKTMSGFQPIIYSTRVDFTGTPSRVDVPLETLPEVSSLHEDTESISG